MHILAGSLAQSRPQVIGGGVSWKRKKKVGQLKAISAKIKPEILTICVGLEVVSHTAKEGLSAKVDAEHADDRATLQITDVIENLVHLESIADGHLNRVRSTERVEMESLLDTLSLGQCQS